MFRCAAIFGLVILFLASVVPGMCQGIPGCYPPPYPAIRPYAPPSPPPVTRTVQVDVPVPCGPVSCDAPMSCPQNPCAPRVYPPPQPQPVQVRVDIRVRPEPCGQQRPDQSVCRDYGALGPIIGMTAAIMSAPIRLLERMFPGPRWPRPPQGPLGPQGAPPHWGHPLAPPARFVSGCPMPACAPVPVCESPTPVPAYQKCVPRRGGRTVVQPADPRCLPGPFAVGEMGR
jgi:hypothetical protein